MTKTAKKRTAARSAAPSRNRPKPSKAGQKGNRVAAVRSGTKQSAAIEMLRCPGGATIAALTKATGWQSHSARNGIFPRGDDAPKNPDGVPRNRETERRATRKPASGGLTWQVSTKC